MDKKFSESLKSLLIATCTLQVRINELAEFEKQWKALFTDLTKEFGPDVKINISNQLLLHTFRYDKFHIVCDDLLSILENEARSEFSVSRNAAKNIYIKSIKDYIEEEKKAPYIGHSIDAKTKEVTELSDMEFPHKIVAIEKRNAQLAEFETLFGKETSEDKRWPFLKAQLKGLIAKITGLRNLFSHRHIWKIQNKYAANWDDLEIEKIEEWFNEFFEIVRKIVFICDGSHFRGTMGGAFGLTVSDQIDLIIFGTIDRSSEIFSEKFPGLSYSSARRKFYDSRHFVESVVSPKSSK